MGIDDEELSNNTYLFYKENPASQLGLIAAKIAFYNFEWRFISLIMFNSIEVLGLQTFLRNYEKTVVVKLGRFVPKHRVPVAQFVIFGEKSSEITTTIQWLIRVRYDHNAKFVIVCASQYNQECDEHVIFETLSKHYVLNVIVLKKSNISDEALAYSYRIVSSERCHSGDPEKINLANCADDKCFRSLFPEQLSNFHRCNLIVSTIEQPPFMYLQNGTKQLSGADGDIIKLAADMLNATLVIMTPSADYEIGRYINNNWTGSLGDVYNSLAMVSVCTAPLTSNKNGNFQISFTYYSMDMVWVAKLPAERASWTKLMHPFKHQVRFALLFVFIGIIFMNAFKETKVWRKVRRVLQIGATKYNMLFYSWLLFLGLPVLKLPTKRTLRIMVLIWILSCFVIRSAYQAALINSLKYPTYQDDLETFRNVCKAGYPYGGPAYLREYYYDDREIYDNWILLDLDGLYNTLEDILDGTTDFVMASNKEIIKYHLMKHNGTKQLQIIPEKIVNSPTVMYLKKFSPLSSSLNYVLRVALEGGFIQRCYGRYLDTNGKTFSRFHALRPEPLTQHHFAGCFAILIIGWFLSIIYFAVEYICGNLYAVL